MTDWDLNNTTSIIQRKDLSAAGLLCNERKSHWNPMQIGKWLGLIINTISMQFSLPHKKVDKPKALLSTALSNGYCSYRFLTKIAGSVLSCALTVGPISRLLTWQMYFTSATRSASDSIVHFTPALLEELRFWYTNIGCFSGYRVRSFPSSCIVMFSDNSHLGFGGYSATLDGSPISGMWTANDMTLDFLLLVVQVSTRSHRTGVMMIIGFVLHLV